MVEADGSFKILINDPHFNHVVPVLLNATITPSTLKSTISTPQPVAELQSYTCTTTMQPSDNQTQVDITISIDTAFTAFKSETIDRQVKEQINKGITDSFGRIYISTIQQVDKYKDKKFLLKIR